MADIEEHCDRVTVHPAHIVRVETPPLRWDDEPDLGPDATFTADRYICPGWRRSIYG